ncbi:hydantoinase B/oxoprolinase family protein [Peribacillus cavernae]|uniref:Hydantoinase B/oxoprolinase family protein n=1 Tax=Peribacillus cavernae TaxID=1674310 RepID=A0A3S0UAM7_9BACI|nr:hydantoinase B/oxoprolinase family protein [Peribacillus cavernae]MDQ0219527.1 N-methylhydantoinase B/oxoprolinase/acetone carboxylase alpha subunit [Peribacillus cavernae]RUQ27061.1 hydantoinase B/oxoprolinase family protein [Peribacillus cavernae]
MTDNKGYENIDPVTLGVIAGSFNSIAKEMALVLYRMAYSSIIRESEDLGAGLFDIDGNEICESDSTPMHIGSLPGYIDGVRHFLGDNMNDGDIILHNNPYYGASHTPDLAIIIPIFYEGKLVAFAANTGHVLDAGGMSPGLMVDVVDVYAEGKHYNAIKLYNKGEKNEEIWRHIFENVRTPKENKGDVEAMIASAKLGKKRYLELIERYSLQTVLAAQKRWMDYSEEMIRKEIAKIPDGVYKAPTGWLDDDGRNYGQRLRIETSVIVNGSDLTVDLSGSSGQVETAYNVPFSGSTLPATYTIVRSILLDEASSEVFIPQNSGIFKPIKVEAPLGSIWNPKAPAACTARINQVQRLADQINLALSEVLPDKTTAGNAAHVHFNSYAGIKEESGDYWVYIEVNEGSYGGRYGKDGLDSVDNLVANTRNNPIEELEMRLPMRCNRYELREEGASAGKWRGGIGIVRTWEFITDSLFTGEGDRHTDPPRGVFGGKNGLTGSMTLNPDTDGEQNLHAKLTNYKIRKGDLLEIRTPCAGGYGNPFERDPQAVLEDILDDFITKEKAKEDYRVVIRDDLTIDEEATKQLRQGLEVLKS